MKNYLLTLFEKETSKVNHTIGSLDLDGNSRKSDTLSILPRYKRQLSLILFQAIILLFMIPSTQAQMVENLETYLGQVDVREATHINMLVNEPPSTLFMYNHIYEMDGESPMVIADVHLNSIEELYGDHDEFENIQLIRIKVRNEEDLDFNLDLDQLKAFSNLRYVYVIITYEMCPPDGRTFDCEKAKVRQLFSTSETNSSSFNIEPEGDEVPVILFKVVRLS